MGAAIKIAAKKAMRFKPDKELAELVKYPPRSSITYIPGMSAGDFSCYKPPLLREQRRLVVAPIHHADPMVEYGPDLGIRSYVRKIQ